MSLTLTQLLMSLCLLGDMVVQGTFLTPTGVFLVSMAIMYLVTAILHPEEFGMFNFTLFSVVLCILKLLQSIQLLPHNVLFHYFSSYVIISPTGMIVYGLIYFICIPSGYLLLTIYSLVNMHIVSWGTRESNK